MLILEKIVKKCIYNQWNTLKMYKYTYRSEGTERAFLSHQREMILALRPQYQAGEGREQPLPWGHVLLAAKSSPGRNFFYITITLNKIIPSWFDTVLRTFTKMV